MDVTADHLLSDAVGHTCRCPAGHERPERVPGVGEKSAARGRSRDVMGTPGMPAPRLRPTAGWFLTLLAVGVVIAVGMGVMLPEPPKVFDVTLVAHVSG